MITTRRASSAQFYIHAMVKTPLSVIMYELLKNWQTWHKINHDMYETTLMHVFQYFDHIHKTFIPDYFIVFLFAFNDLFHLLTNDLMTKLLLMCVLVQWNLG